MSKSFLIFLLFFIFGLSQQTMAQEHEKSDSIIVYSVVDSMPQFPGGESELMVYLRTNILYPSTEMNCGIANSIYLSFIIDTTGKTTAIEILRPEAGSCILSNGFGESLIAMINNMPLWTVGTLNGRKVPVRINLPLKIDFNY